jgi:hypothetical protein
MSVNNSIQSSYESSLGHVAENLSREKEHYEENGVSATRVQENSTETLGHDEVVESLLALAEFGFLEVDLEDNPENIYNISPKCAGDIELRESAVIEEDNEAYWVGRQEDTLTLIGSEGYDQVPLASEDAAKAELARLRTDGGIQEYLEE